MSSLVGAGRGLGDLTRRWGAALSREWYQDGLFPLAAASIRRDSMQSSQSRLEVATRFGLWRPCSAPSSAARDPKKLCIFNCLWPKRSDDCIFCMNVETWLHSKGAKSWLLPPCRVASSTRTPVGPNKLRAEGLYSLRIVDGQRTFC